LATAPAPLVSVQVCREVWSVLVHTSCGADCEYRQILDLVAVLEPAAATGSSA